MRNFQFNANTLFDFSESAPYSKGSDELLCALNELKSKYHFPAVNNDVGAFLSFITSSVKAKTIFEMGSGYGHSAYWYFQGQNTELEKIYLTEKREDLAFEFNSLPWPKNWKNKLEYFQGDAFEKFNTIEHELDFILIDGVKAQYLDFLELCIGKLSKSGIIAIDNSYWRGSFLDEELSETKESAKKIKELHRWIADNSKVSACFLPFRDGLSLIQKR
jgi:predicted O-methyltransferase YrrM